MFFCRDLTRLYNRKYAMIARLFSPHTCYCLLLKKLLWVSFSAQNVSGCKEWPECDCWIYVCKLEQFVRQVYAYYYDGFDDRILRIPGAKFCHSDASVYSQTSNLASFTAEIATKF